MDLRRMKLQLITKDLISNYFHNVNSLRAKREMHGKGTNTNTLLGGNSLTGQLVRSRYICA